MVASPMLQYRLHLDPTHFPPHRPLEVPAPPACHPRSRPPFEFATWISAGTLTPTGPIKLSIGLTPPPTCGCPLVRPSRETAQPIVSSIQFPNRPANSIAF